MKWAEINKVNNATKINKLVTQQLIALHCIPHDIFSYRLSRKKGPNLKDLEELKICNLDKVWKKEEGEKRWKEQEAHEPAKASSSKKDPQQLTLYSH